MAFRYGGLRRATPGAQAAGSQGRALWREKDDPVLGERGREITVTWERGDVFWKKGKLQCTYFLVLIFLEFKIQGNAVHVNWASDIIKGNTPKSCCMDVDLVKTGNLVHKMEPIIYQNH